MSETVVETERLVLESWQADQVDDLAALHGDPRVCRYLSVDGLPWSRGQVESRLAHWMELYAGQRLGKLRVLRKSDGVFIGRAGYGVMPETGEPELGYALLPAHWGHGYAREAAAGLRDWLFEETGWDYFLGFADTRNHASLRILQGIGMRPTHIETDPNGLRAQFHILERPDHDVR